MLQFIYMYMYVVFGVWEDEEWWAIHRAKLAQLCFELWDNEKHSKVLNPRRCIMRVHEKYACSTDTQLPASRKQ